MMVGDALPSRAKVVVYVQAERADTLPYFSSTIQCTLFRYHSLAIFDGVGGGWGNITRVYGVERVKEGALRAPPPPPTITKLVRKYHHD
jgi:hypothetical protein